MLSLKVEAILAEEVHKYSCLYDKEIINSTIKEMS